MKISALPFRFCALFCACLTTALAASLETNIEPAQAVSPTQPANAMPAVLSEVKELRDQLRDMQRSNEEMQRSSEQASEKWTAMTQQNAALSNILTGLQQTLISQKEREIEVGKQANALSIKVISGAAVAVFLVFLFSYWFQLRCLNRVMEFSRSLPAIPPHEPTLLEAENPATSKLLSAMKLLEHRLEQLEVPGSVVSASTNGNYVDVGSSHNLPVANSFPVETAGSSNISLLLAKGQILLDTDRLQDAIGCFQEALAADPNNAEAHLKKGVALERMNRLDLALSSYEEALRLNPKRTIANVYKARVLAALHRYDEAISVYDSALGRKAPKTETPIFVS